MAARRRKHFAMRQCRLIKQGAITVRLLRTLGLAVPEDMKVLPCFLRDQAG